MANRNQNSSLPENKNSNKNDSSSKGMTQKANAAQGTDHGSRDSGLQGGGRRSEKNKDTKRGGNSI